ncbi:pirin-like C-terminal cupin domain-containing protein [Streptomyces sp. NPDC059679]|uniref:pirin-like C-terminal cupin domain-containing protein n=1 Tax=Streptomyces sp. NPDC059679 TaxID=3346903 RepID=UPI003673E72E
MDSEGICLIDTVLRPAALGYVPRGADTLKTSNETDASVRTIRTGGLPFGDEIVTWWNFIGRSRKDIVKAREDWEAPADRLRRHRGLSWRLLSRTGPLPNAAITPRQNPSTR